MTSRTQCFRTLAARSRSNIRSVSCPASIVPTSRCAAIRLPCRGSRSRYMHSRRRCSSQRRRPDPSHAGRTRRVGRTRRRTPSLAPPAARDDSTEARSSRSRPASSHRQRGSTASNADRATPAGKRRAHSTTSSSEDPSAARRNRGCPGSSPRLQASAKRGTERASWMIAYAPTTIDVCSRNRSTPRRVAREGAGDPAVGVVARRVRPVERHVDALEILQAAQIDVAPLDDGARLAGAFDAREEPDRIEEQRSGVRMGEQLGADEPQHRWPEARGFDQPRAHDARRFGSCRGMLACGRMTCACGRMTVRTRHTGRGAARATRAPSSRTAARSAARRRSPDTRSAIGAGSANSSQPKRDT